MAKRYDSYDRRILALLQKDGTLGPTELSAQINLSTSQCSRRLQRLREDGVIGRTVAVLDRVALNLGVSALALVRLSNHHDDNEKRFRAYVERAEEIIACHYVAGELDFILHIVTRDLESYEHFVREQLLRAADIDSCRSNIILRNLKDTTELTLQYL